MTQRRHVRARSLSTLILLVLTGCQAQLQVTTWSSSSDGTPPPVEPAPAKEAPRASAPAPAPTASGAAERLSQELDDTIKEILSADALSPDATAVARAKAQLPQAEQALAAEFKALGRDGVAEEERPRWAALDHWHRRLPGYKDTIALSELQLQAVDGIAALEKEGTSEEDVQRIRQVLYKVSMNDTSKTPFGKKRAALEARLALVEAGARIKGEPTLQARILRSARWLVPAHELFARAPAERFVFAVAQIDSTGKWGTFLPRPVKAGEALLLYEDGDPWALTIDGIHVPVSFDRLSLKAKGGRPATLRADEVAVTGEGGAPIAFGLWDGNIDLEPEYLKHIDASDPRIDHFHQDKDQITKCFAREMGKLDPTNRRAHYDQVTVSGSNVKVEHLQNVLDTKVTKICKIEAFYARRRALGLEVIKPLQQKTYETLQPVMQRLSGLFPR